MKKKRHLYPLTLMARVLNVSRSGFYSWLNRKPSKRQQEDERLKPLIEDAHRKGQKTYGSQRIQKELTHLGIHVGRDHITRLRKELGLRCIQKKKFKATTNSKHNLPVAPNLLNQEFNVPEPAIVYGTDITYIPTDEGWLYLAGVKDLGSREIVGYAIGNRMTKDLVIKALKKALHYRRIVPGCIHHSDRGSQYCSYDYQKLVRDAGMKASMSRKGNCYDNAPVESVWGTLKQELIYQLHFRTRLEAISAIQEWIEVFYNRIRRHSQLGYLAPARWADEYFNKRRAA